ncbi:MAG TPA: hypothetical protein VMW75_14855 [Thermoanaerobaculia bacterium]|nr:hypothetical protein [Thermoanaerobaculia bacterium]
MRPRGKSGAGAAVLSAFLPGLGQFYNNDFKKGLLILVLAIVAVGAIPVTLGSFYVVIWLWGVIDAYRVAKGATPVWA